MVIERLPARFKLTIRVFTVTRRECRLGKRTPSFIATAPRWNALALRSPEFARCAGLPGRTLTPRASSWETKLRDRALPLDLGLPSLGRNPSFLFPVMNESAV
jgi:hypothetical protein